LPHEGITPELTQTLIQQGRESEAASCWRQPKVGMLWKGLNSSNSLLRT